jgi:hypothetical protein
LRGSSTVLPGDFRLELGSPPSRYLITPVIGLYPKYFAQANNIFYRDQIVLAQKWHFLWIIQLVNIITISYVLS